MNSFIQSTAKGSIHASELSDWLIAHGMVGASTEDIAHLLGVSIKDVPSRIMRERKKGSLISPARGYWLAVPPERRLIGYPEAASYIDELMSFLKTDYCVGWLSAAAYYGASHHAPQVFEVAVDRPIRDRNVGTDRLLFFKRDYVRNVFSPSLTRSSTTMKVASVGTTMLMAASDLELVGGNDNAATIIIELANTYPTCLSDVLKNASYFPAAAVRRLGWMLDSFIGKKINDFDQLETYCTSLPTAPSLLSPTDTFRGHLNQTWNLIVNRKVEPDL